MSYGMMSRLLDRVHVSKTPLFKFKKFCLLGKRKAHYLGLAKLGWAGTRSVTSFAVSKTSLDNNLKYIRNDLFLVAALKTLNVGSDYKSWP